MPAKAKKPASSIQGARVSIGSKWVLMEYFDPDEPESPPYLLEVRKDLTFEEADTLQFDPAANPPVTEQWDKLAPFVRDWNLDDADGGPIPAPKAAGGQQFNFLPMAIFWKAWGDLKWRSSGAVESKRFSSSAVAQGTGDDAKPARAE